MKSKEISASLDQAIGLNQELKGLREGNSHLNDENEKLTAKNETLRKERKGLAQQVKALQKQLDDLKTSSLVTEKKLYGELRSMQASWDSLYEQHRAGEEWRERERERQQQKKNSPKKTEENVEENESSFFNAVEPQSQTDAISSVIKKQSSRSKEKVSPMELKLLKLEDENIKLKSAFVKLRTQYREEKYKEEHPENPTSTVSFSDSDSSQENKKPSGPGLFASLSKGTLLGSSIGNSSSISRSTKNLWGKMTTNKNLQRRAKVESINLAYSRETSEIAIFEY